MATNLDDDWERIQDEAEKRIDKHTIAALNSLIKFMRESGWHKYKGDNVGTEEDHVTIAGKLVKRGKGRYMSWRADGDTYIGLDPNYELQHSIVTTNSSVRTLNTTLIITGIVTAFAAIVSTGYIAYQSTKDDGKELRSINKQLIEITLQMQKQQKSQEEISSSLQIAVKDSFYQKKK